jgi:RNA polymerase sigma-70 factor, ECF subfamily
MLPMSGNGNAQASRIFDEGELVRLARDGDVGAFVELSTRFRSKVWGLAQRMLKDSGDAEEVVQETFLAAWQGLAGFRGESAVGSWLYRICANFCLMRLRRRGPERLQPEAELALAEPRFDEQGALVGVPSYDWTRGTEDKALDHELRRAIQSATAALPAEYRAVFLLKDVDGLSLQEIARTLGSTVPGVKSRLHRARLALREAIDAFYRSPAPLRAVA